MRNLIHFFVKNAFIFTFLILECIAFILIFSNFNYQQNSILSSSNEVVGSIYKTYHSFTDYFHLKSENERLVKENAELKNTSMKAFMKVFGTNTTINDTLYKQNYLYSTATVINNEVIFQNNFLTLNKGYLQGIAPGMGVIKGNGVVGIVKNVSKHFSTVMSLLNIDSKLSVRLKRNHFFGNLTWTGINYKYCEISGLPANVKIHKGDTIVTSGYSTIFPNNIPIGKIVKFHIPKGQGFYEIKVKLFLDFKNIDNVFIVKNLFKNEIDTLESKTNVH